MARTVKAFCSGVSREHAVGVDQSIYDMWSDHGSPLYQSKPLGLGGQIECREHRAWAFLPGATPQQIITPPHVRMSHQGTWNERGYYE